MINEAVLLDSMVALTELCKAQCIMISGLGRQVAALRDTVRSLDPTFDEVFEKKYENLRDEALQRASLMLDPAILKLRNDLIL
jgi:hypothetical protein